MKKLIFFPIEIKSRELRPRLLMTLFALKKNFGCFVGDKQGILRATKHFSPGTYFYKSMNHTDLDHITKIKKLNNDYLVLDEEGGFQYSSTKELNKFITIRSSLTNVKLIDKFFTWGVFDHTEWKKRYKDYSKKFKLLGSPRIDLWKDKIIKSIYKNELVQIQNKFKDNYILIISSFITSKKELKKFNKVNEHWFKFRNKKERQIEKKKNRSSLTFFKDYLNMINFISIHNPNINFIIRPHPSENINDWKKLTKNMKKNVHLSNDFDVTPWIYSSKFIIHNSSAVGLQTSAMNKNLITYRPKGFLYDRNYTNKFGIIVKDKKKLNTVIQSQIKIKNIKNLNYKKLKSRLFNIDSNKLVSEQIIKEINKSHRLNSKINFVNFIFLSFIYLLKDIMISFLSRFIKSSNGSFKTLRSTSEKIPGGIRKIEITNFFKDIAFYNKNVNIIKFCNNCFFIYRKSK